MQKIKGLFKVILAAVLMLTLLPATALAAVNDTFIIGGIKYKVLTETGSIGTVEVIENSPRYSGDINIPETVVNSGITYTVTSIGNFAFFYCQDLKSISLPDSVTAIGASAFEQCTYLTNINIPNNVTSIGSQVFSGCSSLTSINIPDNVTSIGDSAFGNCLVLKSISIPDRVTSIGDFAFYCCMGLTSITFSGSTPPSFGANMFNGAPADLQVIVPHGAASAYAAALAGKLPFYAVIKEKEPAVITITAISGVTAPASGAVPVTTITEAEQYTGTVTWAPNDNPFAASRDYTATITLTPKAGYTLTGVAANCFTVAGATSVSNEADSGEITATFPSTALVTYRGAQTRVNDDSTYDIRFVATIDTLNAKEVGFVFSKSETTPTRGNENASEKATSTVYTAITASDLPVTAESLGGAYIIACTVTGIPATDSEVPLHVRAFSTVGTETKYTAVRTVTVSELLGH